MELALQILQRNFKDFDVGIAEGHAATLAGLASADMKQFCCPSTFFKSF